MAVLVSKLICALEIGIGDLPKRVSPIPISVPIHTVEQ